MERSSIFEWTFYGSTLVNWLAALLLMLVSLAGLLLLKRVALGQLKEFERRSSSDFAGPAIEVVLHTRFWFLLLLSARAGALALNLSERASALLSTLLIIAVLIQFAVWANSALRTWLEHFSRRNLAANAAGVTTIRSIVFLARLIVWFVVLLLGLSTLGINVTALIAGLGVGGIAVALAAQNILSDLFSSMSIVIDKPFVVGDFIIVDDFLGSVEHIGLKTTRLSSLGGEQIVFSNSDLLQSRIRNYKKMRERRIVFSFRIDFRTPLDKLRWIPGQVRSIIEAKEITRFDRAHFQKFGDSAFVFEVVYHVLVPGYNEYMDVQQTINFELLDALTAEGIALAYPAQRIHLEEWAPGGERALAQSESAEARGSVR